jgi:hypothetical protein
MRPGFFSDCPTNTKYAVSEVRQRILKPLQTQRVPRRGSDQSRDREGAVFSKYETVFVKWCTKVVWHAADTR